MGIEGGKYILMAKCPGLAKRKTLAQPAQLLTSCVSLATLTNFSKLQITHVQRGYKNIFTCGSSRKHLAQYLVQSKFIKVNCFHNYNEYTLLETHCSNKDMDQSDHS